MRLLSCFIRFCRTREILGLGILGLSYYSLATSHWLFHLGMVTGTTIYLLVEAHSHERMHKNKSSPFHRTHHEHHLSPTPETGVPEAWVFLMYFTILTLLFIVQRPFASGVWVGVITWLMLYEWIHFLCHCQYKPLTKLGWRIRINHNLHHNHDDTKYYHLLTASKRK